MKISGSIDRIEFLSFINFLSLQRRTGIFIIKNEDKEGTIFIKNGEIIDTEYLGERGESAFFNLISIPEFEFSFVETPVNLERKIEISSEILVLEAIKKIDEEKEIFISSILGTI
jgi:hypothetical protein